MLTRLRRWFFRRTMLKRLTAIGLPRSEAEKYIGYILSKGEDDVALAETIVDGIVERGQGNERSLSDYKRNVPRPRAQSPHDDTSET